MALGEFVWLDDLGAACAEHGRYEFFFAAQPERHERFSRVVNPVAIF